MTTTPTPALPLHIGEIVGRRLISEDDSEFWGYFEDGYQGTKKEYVYTADQMREYGRACTASAARVPSDAAGAARHTKEQVLAALENMDDYARMEVGIDAALDMKILTEFIEDASASPTPPALVSTAGAEQREDLHTFLNAAAGEGLVLDEVDAADLYTAIFDGASPTLPALWQR